MKFGNVHRSQWATLAAILASFGSSFRVLTGGGSEAQIPRWMMPRKAYTPNGAQERARRMRQIEACTLRPSNGLVFRQMDGTVIRANSHGYGTVSGVVINLR